MANNLTDNIIIFSIHYLSNTSLFSLFIIYPISHHKHKEKEMKIRITFLAFVLLKFGEGYLSWG